MKLRMILVVLALASINLLPAYFEVAWNDVYQAMTVLVRSAYVNGNPLEPGDEIAVFDGDTCVGMKVVENQTILGNPATIIIVSMEGGDVEGAARVGSFITTKVWDQSTNTVYSYPEMSAWFVNSYMDDYPRTTYRNLETSTIHMLRYDDPSSDTSEFINAPGIAPVPIEYPEAHLAITQLGAYYSEFPFPTYTPNAITAAGAIRVIYIDAPPIGVGFVDAAPDVYSQYHWYIDPGTVGYTASEAYPVVIQLDTTGLSGFVDYSQLTVYKRSIHGTPHFEACNTVWRAPYLDVSITSFSEFILGGPIESTLPVELSSFTGSVALGNSVMLQWITQSETNLAGYRIFRSLEQELESAVMLDAFVEATNSSQTQTYAYYDRELYESGNYYYWLQSMDLDGTNDFHGPVMVAFSPSEPGAPPIVYTPGIKSVYPNPFNPSTTISYALDREDNVKIEIFNVRGQLVKSFDCGHKEAGEHRIDWNATDQNGSNLAGGLYIIRLDLGSRQFSRKVILSK